MSDIKLNFINNSNDANNSQIIIFQKNEAFTDAPAVAWKVIENCGQGCQQPFTYPMDLTVSASDSYGNYFPQLPATDGQVFQVVPTKSSDGLELSRKTTSPGEIAILNGLPTGVINANLYRDGNLLATNPGIAPGQKAVLAFEPTIWIGAASQIQQGEVIDSAIVAQLNNEISLIDIKSADIVMTGGGPGPGSTPFNFTLQNVVYV